MVDRGCVSVLVCFCVSADLTTQGRLSQVQLGGCLGKAPRIANTFEDFKLVPVHVLTLPENTWPSPSIENHCPKHFKILILLGKSRA